jgi:serine/threonine protein kinase
MEGQLIGRYRIVRRLGEGGMGMVFEAVREDIGGRAAVKVLRPELAQNPEIATRFFNEARAANLVEHTGIVRVFDYGSLPSGVVYLAMEYLEGESLGARIKRRGHMSVDDAVRLGRQITGALAAAHAKKVIHRDLKPANVMIVPHEEAAGGEHIKIVDFGIAKLTQDGQNIHTRTGAIMGTPIYMSPEQCRGAVTVDDKSDVYSFGVMLFEMLVGRPPFVAEGQGELIAMHMFAPPPPLASCVAGLPSELLGLMDRILAKDPGARPSMAQVAAELQRIGSHISASGSPPAIAMQQTIRSGPAMAFVATTPPPGMPYATTTPPPGVSAAVPYAATTPPPGASAAVPFVATTTPPSLPPSYTANSFEMQASRPTSKRNRMVVIAALALLVLGGGGAVYRLLSDSPADNEAAAAKVLAAADVDLAGKRWADALAKANLVLKNPAVSAQTASSADSRRAAAEREGRAQQIYDRFQSAGDDYDQALQLYRKLPADSVYRQAARESYDKIFPLFVDKHLKAAADARASGKCEDWRAELQSILEVEPKQAKALGAREQSCEPSAASGVDPKADADAVLSNAQTEYVNGNFSRAIEVAKSVQRVNPTRAWRIIGAAACSVKDVKLASEAMRHLDAASRQYLVYTCQRQSITSIGGGKFKLNE